MSHRRRKQTSAADKGRQGLSLSSPEDGLDPGTVGGQDSLSRRSSPAVVGTSAGDDNSCVLLSYRGRQVRSFEVKGRRLLCLPQAFDLFLRDVVGGLHTIYTKLRRLGVKPVVCSVDQVRVLRILGAIQPGVNRCKMISPTEFDLLYDDCTNTRIRPGRPLKRSMQSRMSHVHGSTHMIENLMKTTGLPEPCPRGAHIQAIDPKLAMTSFPVGLLTWSDLWRRCPSALFPVAGGLDPRGAFDRHPMCWRTGQDSSASSFYLGVKPDSHLVWNPTRRATTHLSTNPPEPRCRNNSVSLRQIHDDDVVNEPLNLEVRGRGRRSTPPLPSDGQTTRDNLGTTPDISVTAETTCNSSESSDTIIRSLSATPPGDCFDNCAPAKTPPIDCNESSRFDDSPSVDCAENLCSVESLLKDVHELVMMAAQNNQRRDRLISYEKEHLEMQVTKETRVRHQVERQLETEKKNRVALQRKLRMERRLLRRLQAKLSSLNRGGIHQRQKVRNPGPSAASKGTIAFQHDSSISNEDYGN